MNEEMEPRLALSVRQPWAWYIMHAGKDIENRDWPTKFRGRIYVHVSKGCTRDEWEDAQDPLWAMAGESPLIESPPLKDLERGGIIGTVEIVDCVRASSSPWFSGTFGFVLRDPRPMPFRPCKGALGFFMPALGVTP